MRMYAGFFLSAKQQHAATSGSRSRDCHDRDSIYKLQTLKEVWKRESIVGMETWMRLKITTCDESGNNFLLLVFRSTDDLNSSVCFHPFGSAEKSVGLSKPAEGRSASEWRRRWVVGWLNSWASVPRTLTFAWYESRLLNLTLVFLFLLIYKEGENKPVDEKCSEM